MTPEEAPKKARELLNGTTPGPWIPSKSGYIGSAAGVMIHDGHVLGDTDADTCLIAAAPTLARMIAGMRAEYRAEYQSVGGHWLPTDHCRNYRNTWVTRQEAERSAAECKADGYPTRIIRRYVTGPEVIA